MTKTTVCLSITYSEVSTRRGGESRPGGYLEDEQNAAVPEVALIGVVLGEAQTPQDLQGLAHTDPAAL